TLALAVSARSRDGDAVPADVLTVTPSTVTVAPGGTATATVTLDRARARSGLYGGYLLATHDGATVSRIPVGYYHEAESYDLTVVGTARDGRPAGGISNVDVLSVTDMRAFAADQVRFTDGKATLRVPPGTYSVTGAIYTYDAAHVFTQEQVLVGDPQVEVTADTTVVLDARHAVPVTVETPAHDSAPLGVTSLSVYRAD